MMVIIVIIVLVLNSLIFILEVKLNRIKKEAYQAWKLLKYNGKDKAMKILERIFDEEIMDHVIED